MENGTGRNLVQRGVHGGCACYSQRGRVVARGLSVPSRPGSEGQGSRAGTVGDIAVTFRGTGAEGQSLWVRELEPSRLNHSPGSPPSGVQARAWRRCSGTPAPCCPPPGLRHWGHLRARARFPAWPVLALSFQKFSCFSRARSCISTK